MPLFLQTKRNVFTLGTRECESSIFILPVVDWNFYVPRITELFLSSKALARRFCTGTCMYISSRKKGRNSFRMNRNVPQPKKPKTIICMCPWEYSLVLDSMKIQVYASITPKMRILKDLNVTYVSKLYFNIVIIVCAYNIFMHVLHP